MIVLVTLTFGLVFWICAWALGVKAFDAFLFTFIITIAAAGVQVALPYVRQLLSGKPVSTS